MSPEQSRGHPGLYRLLAWLSSNFPTGAFSYSHGLEAAAAEGIVCDRAGLEDWIAGLLTFGSGRTDADLVRDAYRAAASGDDAALAAVNRRGVAFRPTAELALESTQQGAAFLAALRAAWQSPRPNPSPPDGGEGEALSAQVCHAAAFGAAAARGGIALADALCGYLQAFAGNLVAAGLRLGLVGQTDGQRILAALEPVVAAAAAAAMARDPADFGAVAFAADLASMAHETQYSRLFRS